MDGIPLENSSGASREASAQRSGLRDWQHWAPYAAVAWSLAYAVLGLYWAVSGRGFPYSASPEPDVSVVGGLGPVAAWVVVVLAGLPAAAVGTAMLLGVRSLRLLFIAAGALIAVSLLLLMTDINVLLSLAYVPVTIYGLLTGAASTQRYLNFITGSTVLHGWLCLLGGFFWLGATVSYARRSGEACLYCGRRDGPEGWTSPASVARWGRIAVYVGMIAPVLYALTRFAWAVGIPLGMSMEHWRQGQKSGTWVSGLFLASFALVGALLMLGLVQRWGEVFPRWMIGLAGRRVPIALAVVPAAIVSVLLIVGGITIWSGLSQMAVNAKVVGENLWVVVGPTLLLPLWGVALAIATLGYYYRRRGPCQVCGRGASGGAHS